MLNHVPVLHFMGLEFSVTFRLSLNYFIRELLYATPKHHLFVFSSFPHSPPVLTVPQLIGIQHL